VIGDAGLIVGIPRKEDELEALATNPRLESVPVETQLAKAAECTAYSGIFIQRTKLYNQRLAITPSSILAEMYHTETQEYAIPNGKLGSPHAPDRTTIDGKANWKEAIFSMIVF
jgi:hypothetical protein